jgi:hypothetical protein
MCAQPFPELVENFWSQFLSRIFKYVIEYLITLSDERYLTCNCSKSVSDKCENFHANVSSLKSFSHATATE